MMQNELCARRLCFIDHLFLASDFCQVPRRNFSASPCRRDPWFLYFNSVLRDSVTLCCWPWLSQWLCVVVYFVVVLWQCGVSVRNVPYTHELEGMCALSTTCANKNPPKNAAEPKLVRCVMQPRAFSVESALSCVGESVCATSHMLCVLPCRVAAVHATPVVRPPKGNATCICLPSVAKRCTEGHEKQN